MHKRKISFIILALVLFVAPSAFGQQQALTNADVVTMTKAGLPESTIILAVQKGPWNFDTSVQALIQLKNQGVSPKVIDAMLQAGRAPAPMQQSPQPGAPATQSGNDMLTGEPGLNASAKAAPMGGVILVNGSEKIQMKYSTPNIRSNSMLGAVVNPFHKTRMRTALNGNHAKLRIANTSPMFEVGLSSDVNATDVIALVKLNAKSETREIETSRASITGVSTGFRKGDVLPISIDESQSTNSGYNKIYTVKPVNPLPPGEYALVVNTGVYYDFGVDSNK